MKFKLYIQGYDDSKDLEKIELYNTLNSIILFLGYSDYEIKSGERIRKISYDDKVIDVDLKIEKVNLGFGKSINYIPKGYKTIIMVKGSKKNIKNIKNLLPKIECWSKGEKDYIATN